MSNYATLKAAIQDVVKTNGNNEITGSLLQQSLLSIIDSIGFGYQFIGVATPSTTPGTPDQRVFYLASAGTYPNFGPAIIPSGSLGVFYYDTAWHVASVAFPIGDGTIAERNIQEDFLSKLLFGYVYKGVAAPNMQPGTLTRNCFYLTTTIGTYENFGNLTVNDGEIAVFKYDADIEHWSKETVSIPQMVEIVNNFTGGIDKALSAEMGKYLKSLIGNVEYKYENINLSLLTIQYCSLGSTGWYRASNTGPQRHIAVTVLPGEKYHLSCTTTSSGTGFYGFVTSSYSPPYSNGDAIPYVSGTTRAYIMNGGEATVDVPTGASFLILCTVDGQGNAVEWRIEKIIVRDKDLQTQIDDISNLLATYPDIEESVDLLKEYVAIPEYDVGEEINISDYPEQFCSLGTSGWYRASSTGPQRHVAIPVTPGQNYRLFAAVTSGGAVSGFYGFVTSSYSPPYSNGNAIPYVSGTGRMSINSGTTKYIVAPISAAYLILTVVDGSASTVNWRMWETEESGDIPTLEQRLENIELSLNVGKIRVGTWNVGHFSLGTSSDTTITHAQFSEMRQKWALKLNTLNADVLCCCEYNTNFVNANGQNPAIPARSSVFALFTNARIGTKYNYNQQAIFSNYKLSHATEIMFSRKTQQRYYYWCEITLGGNNIKIVETHLDFEPADVRAAQITELINAFSSDRYVIIGGDFNVDDSSEFETFINAGYTVANHGYIEDVLTFPTTNPRRAIDNLVCKGFAIGNIQVICDDELSDHSCLFAEFTLQ